MVHETIINGIQLQIEGGRDIPLQFNELKNDEYELINMEFNIGDIIVDIGANVGTVCCYLAKKFPFVRIIAIEPNPITYNLLIKNINLNKIINIKPINVGISVHSNSIRIFYEPDFLGSASSYVPSMVQEKNFQEVICKTKTLDNIFKQENVDFCKLLKIDCEGAEFPCLYTTNILPKIENIKAEFHLNKRLRDEGYTYETLANHCRNYITGSLVFVEREIPN